MDILIGRGPECFNNPGNEMFRNYINQNAGRYQHTVRRREKASIVKSLVAELEVKGCRFLIRSFTGTWVQASARLIEKIASNELRDAQFKADGEPGGKDIDTPPDNFQPPFITIETHQACFVERDAMDEDKSNIHDHHGYRNGTAGSPWLCTYINKLRVVRESMSSSTNQTEKHSHPEMSSLRDRQGTSEQLRIRVPYGHCPSAADFSASDCEVDDVTSDDAVRDQRIVDHLGTVLAICGTESGIAGVCDSSEPLPAQW